MKTHKSLTLLAAMAITALEVGLGAAHTAAAAELDCDERLIVELTPDVRDASDARFLSSLLNGHPAYRLELQRQIDPSHIELELSGPGPDCLCLNVIDAMRKDARVVSIHFDSDDTPPALAASPPEDAAKLWGIPVSGGGIGSLYWAAHHAPQAWRVLLPALE